MTIDLRASTDYEVLRAAEVLARIDEVAHEARVDYLVVGATAHLAHLARPARQES